MKIFVTGDTHSDLTRVLEMYDAITSEDTPEGVPHVDSFDYLIHCGDYKKDAFELGKRLDLPIVCVYGNCDGVREADFDILDTEAGGIVVTHGHMEDVNNTHDGLYALAEDQGCNCVCYGHTHIPFCGHENGFLIINPGSPSRPLDGTSGSCAVITADENGYDAEIIYYSDIRPEETDSGSDDHSDDKPENMQKEPPKKKSGVGGFLRKIFNYSDGQ